VGIENAFTRLRVGFGATVEFGASSRDKVGASIGASIFAVSLLLSYLSKNACTKLLGNKPLGNLQGE
jgi:hypothetical protein